MGETKMGEVVKMDGRLDGLPHPVWFYKECEERSHRLYASNSELLGPHNICIDELFQAGMSVPPRLVGLANGDDEIQYFIDTAVLNWAFCISTGKKGLEDAEKI